MGGGFPTALIGLQRHSISRFAKLLQVGCWARISRGDIRSAPGKQKFRKIRQNLFFEIARRFVPDQLSYRSASCKTRQGVGGENGMAGLCCPRNENGADAPSDPAIDRCDVFKISTMTKKKPAQLRGFLDLIVVRISQLKLLANFLKSTLLVVKNLRFLYEVADKEISPLRALEQMAHRIKRQRHVVRQHMSRARL